MSDGFIARHGLVKYKPNLGRKYPRGTLCELCGSAPRGKPILLFDHCHAHGWVRGLVCNWCNDDLGFLENGVAFSRPSFRTRLLPEYGAYLRNCPGCREP